MVQSAAGGKSGEGDPAGRLLGMDVARFAFALAVLAHHYFYHGPKVGLIPSPGFHADWLLYFKFGVHAFFMISGFVILLTAAGRSPAQFLIARAARLWPAIILCATITFIVTHIFGFAFAPDWTKWIEDILFAPLILGWDAVDWSYWSLAIELRFYALIAIALLFFDVRAHALKFFAVWLAASAAGVFLAGNPVLDALSLRAYSGCFILGGLTYLIWSKRDGWAWAAAMLPAAYWLTARQMIAEDIAAPPNWDRVPHIQLAAYAIALAAWALLAFSLWAPVRWGKLLGARVVEGMGAMSYPLYLVHQLAGYAVILEIGRAFGLGGAAPALIATAGALGAAFICAFYWEPWAKRLVRDGLTRALALLAPLTPAPLWRRIAEPRLEPGGASR